LWLADSKRVLRGWFPLTLDRTISWLTYLQVRLKMQDMFVDSTGGAVPRAVDSSMNSLSTSPINSVGSSSKVSSELSVCTSCCTVHTMLLVYCAGDKRGHGADHQTDG
jgi:hypothetical protein